MKAKSHLVDVEIDLADYVDEIKSFVSQRFNCEEVFDEAELRSWAEDMGYVLPKEDR